jgi:hypothetical protein
VIEAKYISAGFMQCGKLMCTILWVPLLLDVVFTDLQWCENERMKDGNTCLIDIIIIIKDNALTKLLHYGALVNPAT